MDEHVSASGREPEQARLCPSADSGEFPRATPADARVQVWNGKVYSPCMCAYKAEVHKVYAMLLF